MFFHPTISESSSHWSDKSLIVNHKQRQETALPFHVFLFRVFHRLASMKRRGIRANALEMRLPMYEVRCTTVAADAAYVRCTKYDVRFGL